VLDPVKLLNSYGRLCITSRRYSKLHKAGGFEDARVWFLTGHTWLKFLRRRLPLLRFRHDGLQLVGAGDPRRSTVASVHQIEQDGQIMLCKRRPRAMSMPSSSTILVPADVRAPPLAACGALHDGQDTGCFRSPLRVGAHRAFRFGLVSG
jgi:hypothetical protein